MRWTRGACMPAAFWLALTLLVVNDHVLKGSGLLPGIVTGKLSDFAGLVVAPLLLCALFDAHGQLARYACIALVALPFAAIKLSPWAASGVADALSLLVPSHIWCDPTDLVALCVLPWTAQLAQRVEPIALGRLRPQRVGLALAALACVATSESGPYTESFAPPLLINWTLAPIEVTVVRQRALCDRSAEATSSSVEYTVTLAPTYMAPLGWTENIEDASIDADCRRVELRVAGRSFHTFWTPQAEAMITHEVIDKGFGSPTQVETFQLESDDDWAFERAFTLVGSASAPELVVGAQLDARVLQ